MPRTRLNRREVVAQYRNEDNRAIDTYRYQPTRLFPAVWAFPAEYVTVTARGEKPPGDYAWERVTEGRGTELAAECGATIWSADVRAL